MSLNLLKDPWIPVIRKDGKDIIQPYQIAELDILRLDWPRPDFNLACIELLIGLVSLADPPKDDEEWDERFYNPDGNRLKALLEQYDDSFNLGGTGPRFMQDFEAFEEDMSDKDMKPVDILFIDSASKNSETNNSDLMVKRNRFKILDFPTAAMALYTLQSYAGFGGAGNRVSMRGGGPMTVLIKPQDECLWKLVWSNVQLQQKLDTDNVFPWISPTTVSNNGISVTPEIASELQAFFGMPRRLRLKFKNNQVTGVFQKKHGIVYEGWQHPLTPYYRQKEDAVEWLSIKCKSEYHSYRNWLGTLITSDKAATNRLSYNVQSYYNRPYIPECDILVGGWAMNKSSPLTFKLQSYPNFCDIQEESCGRIKILVEAANSVSDKLSGYLNDYSTQDFFIDTEDDFIQALHGISINLGSEIEIQWHKILQSTAIKIFDEHTVYSLSKKDIKDIEKTIVSRKKLLGFLSKTLRKKLSIPLTEKEDKK